MSNVFEHLDIEYEELNKLGIVDITMVKGERGSSGDYENLSHLPKINGVTVTGNKTSEDYGINVIDDYEELNNLPKINNVTLTGNKTSNDLSLASQASMQSAELRLTVVENKIATIADPTDEQVAEAVDAWLDEHPEATTTVEDGAVTFPKLASDVADLFINEEATAGDIVSFDDGAKNIPLKDLQVNIEAVQNLNGYDNPWVGGAGKNKLAPFVTAQTLGNIIYTVNSDGTFKTSGTANANSSIMSARFRLPVGTYTLSGCPSGGSGTTYYLRIIEYSGTSSTVVDFNTDVGNGCNYTVQSASDDILVFTQIINGTTAPSGTWQPMLRLSTTTATFEPYENICPISGWDEVSVTRAGKNLFEPTFLAPLSGLTLTQEDSGIRVTGTLTTNTNRTIINKKMPAGTYTIHGFGSDSVAESNTYQLSVRITPESTGISTTYYVKKDSRTVTLTERSDVLIRLYVYTGGNPFNYILPIQLEEGSVEHAYEPYNGQTYTIDLNGTRYGGTLDVTTGVLTITHGLFDLGSTNYVYSSNYGGYFYVGLVGKKAGDTNIYADCYANAGATSVQYMADSTIKGRTTDSYIFIKDSRFTDAGDLKTALNGHYAVYELATPQTVQLTPTQVTTLLGQNNVWCDTGEVTNLEYRADTKLYIDKAILSLGGNS